MSGLNNQNEIGQRVGVPSDSAHQGEHGVGHGLSGGHSHATGQNTQSGAGSAHPIADKFTSDHHNQHHHTNTQSAESGNYSAFGTGRVPLASGITGAIDEAHAAGANSGLPLGKPLNVGSGHEHGGHHTTTTTSGLGAGSGLGSHSSSTTSGAHSGLTSGTHSGLTSGAHSGATSGEQAVSGAYAGGKTTDALTGESHARTTGAGVGPLAENMHGATGATDSSSGHRGLAAAGAGLGAAGLGAGAAGAHSHGSHGTGIASSGAAPGTGLGAGTSGAQSYGTGVGPAGGAGGHYDSPAGHTSSTGLPSGAHTGTGAGLAGVGAGAGIAGAGAGAAGLAGNHGSHSSHATDSTKHTQGAAGGPVLDPKELDTGNKHSLVFDEKTGKYVHRHDLH